ncbi:hypothetical protein B0H10DRAFT_2086087, partial [Mycena sp. CBHHK59/15]
MGVNLHTQHTSPTLTSASAYPIKPLRTARTRGPHAVPSASPSQTCTTRATRRWGHSPSRPFISR